MIYRRMKSFPAFTVVTFLLFAGLFFAGCSTFASRSEEMASVFDPLPAETKMRLKNEDVRLGDTKEMVYVALGEPDGKTVRTDESGTGETWYYLDSYQRYGGSTVTYAPRYYSARNGRVITTTEPIFRDYYYSGFYVRRQIVFRGGKVTEVVSKE